MPQLTLTPTQLQVLKEALEFYLDGFSEDDAPNEYKETKALLEYVSYSIKQLNFDRDTTIKAIQRKLEEQHGKGKERGTTKNNTDN